jgi:hypothetical protein
MPEQGFTALMEHGDCLNDPGSCPDQITCPVLATYTLEQVREMARVERLADEAAWEAERVAYEEEVRRLNAEVDAAQMREVTTWAAVDLRAILTGDLRAPQPKHLARTDGVRLLYAGRTHSFIGESESGKTTAAYIACAQVLLAGGGVVYVDFEGEAIDFARWMLQLGVPADVVAEHARYCRPDEAFDKAARLALRSACLDVEPQLVVFDGVTEGMMLHDLDDRVGTDTTRFMNLLPRPVEKVGRSVILIDHVPHGGDRATGSQMKRSTVSGASYLFTRNGPLIPGKDCKVEVEVKKDRPGQVRNRSLGGKKVGTLHLSPDPERGPNAVDAYIEAPKEFADAYRPGNAMERVSRFIEDNEGAGRTKVADSGGDKVDNREALDFLVQDGFVTETEVGRHRKSYASIRPYRT